MKDLVATKCAVVLGIFVDLEEEEIRLATEREGYEVLKALVTRPAATEVALADRDASIVVCGLE